MPNHVHIITVPSGEDGLCRTFADAHRRYTGYLNARMRVAGHWWQGRFSSVVMDEEHLANEKKGLGHKLRLSDNLGIRNSRPNLVL